MQSQELFVAMDKNRDGRIDADDLQQALEQVRPHLCVSRVCIASYNRGQCIARAVNGPAVTA